MRLVFLVLVTTLASASAQAFEQDGLSGGMKESDAARIFSSFGSHQRQAIEGFPDSWIYITDSPSFTRAIQTCKGRLATYQREIPGGWHAFMRTLQREDVARGPGKYSWGTGETQLGPHDSISIVWKTADKDTYLISYGQTGESRPFAYQLFKAANGCGL